MKPTRDDLFVWVKGDNEHHEKRATDADLAAMGLVQAPECGECGGEGIEPWDGGEDSWVLGTKPCPQCGGSGYGRLVNLNLDVDVAALREAARIWEMFGDRPSELTLINLARQVLAALDGETTE